MGLSDVAVRRVSGLRADGLAIVVAGFAAAGLLIVVND
jgi:hypothetical protein